MITALVGDTKPAAGVIVASPATEPVSRPRDFGLRDVVHSTKNHHMPANAAARSVLRNAVAVVESTLNSLPALKPYQPNHSRPVPSATSGMLCGSGSETRSRPT